MEGKDVSSSKHVMLLPDKSKAKFGNLFKQFCFTRKHVSESELLNHSVPEEDEEENKLLHKMMIFVSIFLQIALKHLSTPMKFTRDLLEGFLNRGVPNRESDKYYTFIGHSDYRLDLDKKLKRGDARYCPSLSMMASKISYENKAVIKKAVTDHWKMEYVDFYNFYNEFQHKSTTQAFICRDNNIEDGDIIVVAFRGTSMFLADDWSTDVDYSWVKIDGMGKAHMGFMMALGLNKYAHGGSDYLGDFLGSWPDKIEHDPEHPLAYYTLRDKLKDMMSENKNARFVVTGHSLGGALAVLFPAVLALHGEDDLLNRLEGIYTFGQPRVGDQQFGNFMKRNLNKYNIRYNRIVYGYDIVPKVPFDSSLMTFKHFGRCIKFNCLYHGKVKEEEQQRRGSVILWVIIGIIGLLINMVIARLAAVWELIRGLFIGVVKGSEYREGWTLFFLRIVGIIAPSMINHFPQDYVNSTRLASEDLFRQ